VNRYGTTPVILAGLTSNAVAYALFLGIGLHSNYVLTLLPTFLLVGVGFALAYGPLNIGATNGIAPEEQGVAGGLVITSFQFGGAFVLAVTSAVLNTSTGVANSPQAMLDGFQVALIVPLVAAVLGMAATAIGLTKRSATSTGPDEDAGAGADRVPVPVPVP
jgi:MFS family permease